MPKVSKTVVNKDLRDKVFASLLQNEEIANQFQKINDRQYGGIMTDLNGEQVYVRIGVIVAEAREDMTAEELMASEIQKYEESVAKALEKKTKAKEKAEADKKKREEAKNNEA